MIDSIRKKHRAKKYISITVLKKGATMMFKSPRLTGISHLDLDLAAFQKKIHNDPYIKRLATTIPDTFQITASILDGNVAEFHAARWPAPYRRLKTKCIAFADDHACPVSVVHEPQTCLRVKFSAD